MNLSSLQLQSGTLMDVLGPAISHEGYTFVPADVEFSGYENGAKLLDAVKSAEASVRAIVRPGQDAPWACSRIQKLFHQRQRPEVERGEKCCMSFSFLAVVIEHGLAIAIPFLCSDYYGESELLFGDDPPPDTKTQQEIGRAFWSLLLQDVNDLVDFTDRMEHLGAGVTIEFGVADGEPFMRELTD